MLKLLTQPEWTRRRREPLQKYTDYVHSVRMSVEGIPTADSALADSARVREMGLYRASEAARSRGEDGLRIAFYSYSAGATLDDLASLVEPIVEFWRVYSDHHLAFHRSPECDGHLVPHIDLYDRDCWEALQLVCFAILLGRSDLLGRHLADQTPPLSRLHRTGHPRLLTVRHSALPCEKSVASG